MVADSVFPGSKITDDGDATMKLKDAYFLKGVTWASLVVQRVKRLQAMQEPWVRVLGLEDPLEKEMATHSSTLAWEIQWI